MIVLQHFIHYKALSYICCEWQCSESCWPFARPRLIFTLWPPFVRWRIVRDTRPSRFSCAYDEKSWVWAGDEAILVYNEAIHALLCAKGRQMVHAAFHYVKVPKGSKMSYYGSANNGTNWQSWFSDAGKGQSPLSLQNRLYCFFAEFYWVKGFLSGWN